MKSKPRPLLLAAALLLGSATLLHAQIKWRVSVNFILDADGNRPATGNINTDQDVRAYLDYGNEVLRKSGRGYQLDWVETNNIANAPKWFAIDADGDADDVDAGELEKEVEDSLKNGPNKFKFRKDAINLYIVGSSTQGSCTCGRSQDSDILVLSQNINPDWVILHESGHFLSLPHTHDGEEGDENNTACRSRKPGDDGIDDTLPDNSCWTFNQLMDNSPGASLIKGTNTFFNIMAKHGSTPGFRYILTSDQLDAMTDASNTNRREVATGDTIFVDNDALGLFPTGNSKAPYKKLKNGLDAATSGDIVLMRPGGYTEERLITKAVTLRATRGNATVRAK